MTFTLILLGALPFVIGGALNSCMLAYADSLLPLTLIAVFVLFIWGCIAFFFNKRGNRTKQIIIFLNLVAALDLFAVGIQELILHAYWMNAVGSWSQLFYLPVLNLGLRLTAWSHSMFFAYAASFILMLAATFFGCKLREKTMR